MKRSRSIFQSWSVFLSLLLRRSILEYNKYNCFLLIYPNSNVSSDMVLDVFKSWEIEYKYVKFEIKNFQFYNDLYGLDERLSRNKARQCGCGTAKLYLYKLPIDMVRLRPTFSEIKPCNVFAFDIKHAMRNVDGKNLIHGSTDYNEYLEDTKFLMNYMDANVSEFQNSNRKFIFLDIISVIKPTYERVKGRMIYTHQKLLGYSSFFLYRIRCLFIRKYKISPCFLGKWRWSSKYFFMDDGQSYFFKIPNKFENPYEEKKISILLNKTGYVEKCDVVNVFGLLAVKKKWVNMRIMSLEEFFSPNIRNQIVKLFSTMELLAVHHADIKYDNLQYDEDQHSIILIDFGLSSSTLKTDLFKENVKEFDFYRWNDGWNLLDALISKKSDCNYE